MLTRSQTRRRTKIRRSRYISLCRELASSASPEATETVEDRKKHEQLHLFPLHPEPLFHDKDDDHDSTSSFFFDPPEYAVDATTLTSLLGSTGAGTEERLSTSPSTTSVNYGLAKAALRGRERWVFCGEEDEEEGVASSGHGGWSGGGGTVDLLVGGGASPGMLCLKLDYEEVLSAWSDKGSLFINGEGPQVVPHLHHHQASTVYVEVGGTNNIINNNSSYNKLNTSCSGSGGLWVVPDQNSTEMSRNGSREERVMRYREKRHSRLFSKRIRYEVRKLNAEKRPRIKGRFVKRMQEEEELEEGM